MPSLNLQNTIIALDLDGTLLRTDKSVSEFTVNTLCNLSQKGAKICFVTGRRERVAATVLKPFTFPAWLISSNGTTCSEWPNRERIYLHYYPKRTVENVIGVLSELDKLPVLIIDSDEVPEDMVMDESHLEVKVYEDYYNRNKNYIIIEKDIRNSKFLDCVTGMFLTEGNGSIQNVISFLESKNNDKLKFYSLDNLDYLPTHTILEILEQGWTKWDGICRLIDKIGNKETIVIAFGDDHNDIDMLTFADISYAMENAISGAKAAAKYIAPSNNEDGVAKVLMEIVG